MERIDGRVAIVDEIASAQPALRKFIVSSLRQMCRDADFQEALPGYLPSDAANQKRLPLLRQKLASLTAG